MALCVLCDVHRDHTFMLPKTEHVRERWMSFLNDPKFANRKLIRICDKHFKKEDFTNYNMVSLMSRTESKLRLRLKPDAIPSRSVAEIDHDSMLSQHARLSDENIPSGQEASTSTSESLLVLPPQKNTEADLEMEPETSADELDDEINDPTIAFSDFEEPSSEDDDDFYEIHGQQDFFNKEGNSYVLVPWKKLVVLLKKCERCKDTALTELKSRREGAAVMVEISCGNIACGWTTKWCNSELVNSQYLINILISASILFSGGLPTKILRLFDFIGVAMIAANTYFVHQKKYLNKVVRDYWEREQTQLREEMAGKAVSLAGDARCDSMGHSAKYSSYSMMDVGTNKVFTVQLIQTDGNSTAMELQGLKECFNDLLHRWKVNIEALVTDRHVQVRKYMREMYGENRKDQSEPCIRHYFDIWHVAKGLKKELQKAAQGDSTGMIAKWSGSIITHLYWCALSTPDGNSDIMEAKYTSMMNHLVNVHKHDSLHYNKCCHRRKRRGEKKKDYFKRGSAEYERVVSILDTTRRINDVRQLSPIGQTSSLEAYHSCVNHFAPKMIHFQYPAMKSRLLLAAIHFNANTSTEQGKLMAIFPKFKKGGVSVRKEVATATHDYAYEMIEMALQMRTDANPDVAPPTLTVKYRANTNTEEAIAKYTSRFRQPIDVDKNLRV